jgi:hypothetical protein
MDKDKKSILEKLEEVSGGVIIVSQDHIYLIEERTGRVLWKALKELIFLNKGLMDDIDCLMNSMNIDRSLGVLKHGTYTRLLPGPQIKFGQWTF